VKEQLGGGEERVVVMAMMVVVEAKVTRDDIYKMRPAGRWEESERKKKGWRERGGI
jgi:hypothetical protein